MKKSQSANKKQLNGSEKEAILMSLLFCAFYFLNLLIALLCVFATKKNDENASNKEKEMKIRAKNARKLLVLNNFSDV